MNIRFLKMMGWGISFYAWCINAQPQLSSSINQKDKRVPDSKNTLFSERGNSGFADTILFKRFLSAIKLFEKDDSLHPDRKVDVVFTGSSSIRKWKTLESDIKNMQVLNRGFGGSTLPELIYYSDILIFKHKPKVIVIYIGENDISSKKADTLKVVQLFIYLQKLIEQRLPESSVFYVSLKPSRGKWNVWPQLQAINSGLIHLCETNNNCFFIDVRSEMLDSNGLPRKDIYLPDLTHLNSKGYEIWTRVISAALIQKIP